jgi:branched-chain amino acid transport system ATP-binding protein
VLHNLELGGYAAPRGVDLAVRIEQVLARFPVLRRKANAQVSTLSGGQQKLLEIARALLLDPKLLLIDEPSIGLSPLMVQETFAILADMRSRGVSVLMVEQNAKTALQRSDWGLVLELGETRLHDRADAILADPRVGQLFLGGGMASGARAAA